MAQNPSHDTFQPGDRPARVAERAYARFLDRGGEHGHDLEDWLDAERQVEEGEARLSSQPQSRRDR